MEMLKVLIVLFLFHLTECLSENIILGDDHSMCLFKKCLFKCCPKNQYLKIDDEFPKKCVDAEPYMDMSFPNISLYDSAYHTQPVKKLFNEVFLLKPNLLSNDTFRDESYLPEMILLKSYLNEDGVLYLEFPNAFERWIPLESDFCIDYITYEDEPPEVKFCIYKNTEEQPENDYYYIGLIVSSVFLSLVLIVYIILPELRNMGGMILMAYIVSLLGAFITLTCVQMGSYSSADCIILTTMNYFFFISAFSWMNVMSVDIWWTFRGYAKARPIHRRGEKFKFCMYCLYAWGMPLAMAIMFVVINNADLSDIPWFVQPQVPRLGCFITGGQQLLYFYVPMLILILCNWTFYLMTAFNIWRLSRGTARAFNPEAAGNPAAHQRQKQRLMVYLKLSVIMGINWILEVLSSFTPQLSIWTITDFYNILIGFTIFLIFVCKKSIYNKLMIRCRGIRKYQLPKRSLTASFTLESNLSQEMPPSVCLNPKGERKRSTEQKPSFEI